MDQRGIYAITIRFLPWGGSFRGCLDFRSICWKTIRPASGQLGPWFDFKRPEPDHQSVSHHTELQHS
jgi:hypothetical protein